MTDKSEQPDKELEKGYGTSTEGAAPPPSLPDDAIVENPVGFGEDSGSLEAANIETGEESSRTSVEEPV